MSLTKSMNKNNRKTFALIGVENRTHDLSWPGNRLEHFNNGFLNSCRIEPAFVMEFHLFTMFNNGVRYSQSSDMSRIIVVRHELEYCTTQSALNTTVFDCNYFFVFRKNFVEQFLI